MIRNVIIPTIVFTVLSIINEDVYNVVKDFIADDTPILEALGIPEQRITY